EGPHITRLPDNILRVLSNLFCQCLTNIAGNDTEAAVQLSGNILKCLIIISRNFDNVPLVASCEFVKHVVTMATNILQQITEDNSEKNHSDLYSLFCMAVHFLECLYDPYFVWRKRLKGWTVDKSRMTYKPAALHVEVVPFFYDCCANSGVPTDLRLRLLHMFGAIMCGMQHNGLRVITPATLDVLLKMISDNEVSGPANETRQELWDLRELVLKCIICMVHVIHASSPDQRQVEVSHVLEGYMQVLMNFDLTSDDEHENQVQLTMIGAINEMLSCQDRNSLQVILVTGGTFDTFISLLQKTSLTGHEAQRLAMSVLKVMSTVLSGSVNAKERFSLRVGYIKFVEALKSLGQPSSALLQAVLDLVVEGDFDISQPQLIQNTQAAIMLLCWLPDIQSHDLQIWLAENLCKLCIKGHNKLSCCNDGMISAILTVLAREKQVDQKAIGHLIDLLEELGTQSITATELKKLIGLLKTEEGEEQSIYCSRLMRCMSTMARREGKDSALQFFHLKDQGDCISLPGFRKWPGGSFSFHAWLRLDCDTCAEENITFPNQTYRRQLYSFVSSTGCGFEAFFTPDFDLVLSVFSKKEHSSAIITETELGNAQWHSIDVVHSSSRRPFANSHLNVYIDGKLRLSSQLKFPNMTEPLTSCKIGSPSSKATISALMDQNASAAPDVKSRSPFKLLFQRQSGALDPDITTVPMGTQDDVWGLPITMHGQLGSVCIFHDVVQPGQVKAMFNAGPNHTHLFSSDEFSELADLTGKMVLFYHAKDVINCIGGIQVLFPLLEHVNKAPMPRQLSEDSTHAISNMHKGIEQDDWIVVPSSSYADSKLEQNPVAGFLTLLRHMLHSQLTNQETFTRTSGAAVISALLQKVNPKMIDVNVLMAVQLLVETIATVNQTLLQHLYQYILFDFRIWSQSDFPVRIGHIQYLSTIIKDDRRFFRKKFGVQYILDVIRTYYSDTSEGNENISSEDIKTIRVSLLSLVKYYIVKEVRNDELSAIVRFIVAAGNEHMICEALDILINLLESKTRNDQLYLQMFEPEMAEMFYGLLVYPGKSIVFYEKIVKVLYLLLRTDRVYEKSKVRLRLTECGHLGLIGLMMNCDVSGPMVKRYLDMVAAVDATHSYNAVLAVLQLIHYSGSDIKLEASRQLLSILVSRPGAAKQFAKQLGWQESITKLFIHQVREGHLANEAVAMEPQEEEYVTVSESDIWRVDLPGEDTPNKVEQNENEENSGEKESDPLLCSSGNTSERGVKPPENLNLSVPNCDSPSSVQKSPSTPFYLSRTFDYLEDDRSRTMSRSSSASVEDLTNNTNNMSPLTQNKRTSFSHSTSQSSFSLSDSAIDLNQSNSSMTDSGRGSIVISPADNIQKALDNLGIQKIYVKDNPERTEELCQNLLIVLLTIMWRGVEGSDEADWKERGQVFSWIDRICEGHVLIRSPVEIKRRLLEMMIHSSASDIRETAQALAAPMENAMELVRLVHCFMISFDGTDTELYSERLIEDLMGLLDNLAVWDVESDGGWKEMARLGLSLLIHYASQSDIELCAIATAKLHVLVQTKLISSSAEASFLIGNLDNIIKQAVIKNTDNYSFLIPVLKALIEKGQDLLSLDLLLPSLPTTSRSPTFFDDFKQYCMSEEWKNFIENYVTPQKIHFEESAFGDLEIKNQQFWAECKELMMVNMHRRNRERGDSKLKFENMILNPFQGKVQYEERRFQNVTIQMRNQHLSVLRQWRATKAFFTGERGAWVSGKKQLMHMKLSNQENFQRMKVKLVPNYNYDPHTEASILRDNLGMCEATMAAEIEKLKVAKEAVISKDNIGDDALGDEEWNVISQEDRIDEAKGKEKLVLSEECDLVTMMNVVKGRLEVTTSYVYFFDCSQNREEGGEDFKWSLSQLREIHLRRYNLRRSAIEVFLVDQTNYFLNFSPKVRNKVYSKILSLRPSNLIYFGSRSPMELLKSSGLTKKWVQRDISNFEYLMQLNTIAGRTYNDLSQYPVFPWILCDYTSDNLDLDNPAVYRDLSKPVGAVNPKNEKDIREKYNNFEDPSGVVEKFHYGTHYSNSAGVMHYMLRMEPFTSLHIQLQSGRFDVADRQFHSIPATWQSLMENPNDVKELIPEFFYLPEFLVNMNNFDLGKLQFTGERINHVELPRWAKSPEDFIYKHRQALESDYVSANLHHWIDLIFGYKQKGPAAVEALNVFYYCTYEGAVDLDAVKDDNERKALEGMINNFGQTPCQLLKDAHPRRHTMEEVIFRSIKFDKPLSVFQFVDHIKVFYVEVSPEGDPLVYVSVPLNQSRSILPQGNDSLVTVSTDGVIGVHGWLPYDKSISNYFTFEKDPYFANLKSRRRIACAFAPGLKIDAKLFVVTHDAKLLISVGHWDCSVQVYHLGKAKKINQLQGHIDVVTCLALDSSGSHLITGSSDTTCIIWQVYQQQSGTSVNVNNRPLHTLCGHDAEVTAVQISVELDAAISASKDGTVVIHTVRRGHYLRSIRPPCTMGYTMNIPYIEMNNIGHIVIYCHERFPIDPKERFSLHLYTINGEHLFTESLPCGLGHMKVTDKYLVTGDIHGHLNVLEIFGLRTLTSLPLHATVCSLAVTNGNSHILAGLYDGKLIIISVKNKSEIR
ncbi:hypothetical protein FSP39_025014, partial [Pinctada imbricata]